MFQRYQNEGKTTYEYHTPNPLRTTRQITRKQKTKSQELSHQEEATSNRKWKQYPVPKKPKFVLFRLVFSNIYSDILINGEVRIRFAISGSIYKKLILQETFSYCNLLHIYITHPTAVFLQAGCCPRVQGITRKPSGLGPEITNYFPFF